MSWLPNLYNLCLKKLGRCRNAGPISAIHETMYNEGEHGNQHGYFMNAIWMHNVGATVANGQSYGVVMQGAISAYQHYSQEDNFSHQSTFDISSESTNGKIKPKVETYSDF